MARPRTYVNPEEYPEVFRKSPNSNSNRRGLITPHFIVIHHVGAKKWLCKEASTQKFFLQSSSNITKYLREH